MTFPLAQDRLRTQDVDHAFIEGFEEGEKVHHQHSKCGQCNFVLGFVVKELRGRLATRAPSGVKERIKAAYLAL